MPHARRTSGFHRSLFLTLGLGARTVPRARAPSFASPCMYNHSPNQSPDISSITLIGEYLDSREARNAKGSRNSYSELLIVVSSTRVSVMSQLGIPLDTGLDVTTGAFYAAMGATSLVNPSATLSPCFTGSMAGRYIYHTYRPVK